jgi:hypothetical protein
MRFGVCVRTLVPALLCFPHPTLAQLPQSPSLWRLAIAGGWGWESNVAMRNPPYVADAATLAMAEASVVKHSSVSHIAFTASGSVVHYRELRSLDRYAYDAQGVAERRFTNRWSGFLRGSARMSLSSEASINDQPVLLPLVVSRTQSGAAGSAYRISPLTTANVEGRFTHATFDAPGFTPTRSTGGRFALVHRYDPRSDYGVTYAVDEYAETVPSSYVQSMTADWAPRSARVGARFSAGLSNVGNSMSAFSHLAGTGSAYVETLLAHGVTYLRFARFAGQSFGLGRILITNQVGAGYSRAVFRGTDTHLSVDRAWSEDALTPGVRSVTTNVSARIAKQFASGLTIGTESFFQHRADGGRVSDRGVRVVAGYAIGSWRAR